MEISHRITFPVGAYGVNCTILVISGITLIIDPGAEATLIAAKLRQLQVEPTAILLTHGHFDHIGAVNELQRRWPAIKVYVGRQDIPMLTHPFNQYPPEYPPVRTFANLIPVDESTVIEGLDDLRAIATPGHTPGGFSYLIQKLLFAGDTLFAGSVGRTDFPGGDMATLKASLEKLQCLDDDLTVVPGHGPFTTIGREKADNPFLQF